MIHFRLFGLPARRLTRSPARTEKAEPRKGKGTGQGTVIAGQPAEQNVQHIAPSFLQYMM